MKIRNKESDPRASVYVTKKLFSIEEMSALSIYKATPFLARSQFLEFLR